MIPSHVELNRLVAEKVFGWAVRQVPCIYCGTEHGKWVCRPVASIAVDQDLPDFAGDIAQAWRVVEKIVEHGNSFSLDWTFGRWVCSFSKGENAFDGPPIECSGVERGICLAALKAMGVEVPA